MTSRRNRRASPGGKVGGEADEPRILPVVGRAGLAGDRLADRLDGGGGAALDDALHHLDDLEGGERIGDLLAVVRDDRHRLMAPLDVAAAFACPLVGAENGFAVAVLDAVDEGRRDALPAIVEHRVRGGVAQRRRLAGAERHRIPRHTVHDAEFLNRLADRLHPDHAARRAVTVLSEAPSATRNGSARGTLGCQFDGVQAACPRPG